MEFQSILKIYYRRVKNWVLDNENSVVLVTGILLISAISFGLGALWRDGHSDKAKIVVNKDMSAFAPSGSSIDNIAVKSPSTEKVMPLDRRESSSSIGDLISTIYIASKSGKAYHLPNCPGAKQIKPENRIEFKSREEAEKAGYKPASNCKGI